MTHQEAVGEVFRKARLDHGYISRSQFVQTKRLKGKITSEGLRKIEAGERLPRFNTLRRIAKALDLPENRIKALEKVVLAKQVARVTHQVGSPTVTFQIEGKPVKVYSLPPKRKMEAFVRDAVGDLLKVVYKYGVLPEDLDHFRIHARAILLDKLKT